jgi:indolepyruvate decarboxylase
MEQVQLHDILGGLVTAGIPWRGAGDFPRPLAAPGGEMAEIYLQTKSGEKIPIPMGESIAGRLPGNSIHIDETGVSRRHASFRRQGNQVLVSDLNSSNGTFINDILLKPDRPMPLSNGDEIGLGRQMTLRIVGPLQKAPQAQLDEELDNEDTMLELLAAAEEHASAASVTVERTVDPPRFHAREGEKVTSGRMFEAINAYLDEQTVVIADNGETLIAGIDLLIPTANGFFAPGYFTSVGFAVPTAMGVQLANPAWRPLVLVGDAAFQMTGAELSTMVRHGLNPIVIVMNNGGYGSERPFHDSPYVDVLRWNYAKYPMLLGAGRGYTVNTEEEMAFALSKAQQHTESFVIIDVVLEKFDYSPSFERFLSYFVRDAE